MPEEIRAGQVNFVVTNEGSELHSVVVEGNGLVFELPAPLDSGESSILSAELPPGEYVVYCPIGDGEHRDKGMEATLLVVP
jgi:plastocyanin